MLDDRMPLFTIAVAGVLGYLVGSFPTAYVLVRHTRQLDIRHAGSGNVGALNSYQVTGSRLVGVLVLVLDLLKGAAAAAGGEALVPSGGVVAGVLAVLGHNYPPWLGWKGGRGLAPAAGVSFVVMPALFVGWVVCWLPAFLVLRHVNVASAVGCTCVLLLALVLPGGLWGLGLPEHAGPTVFRVFVAVLMIILLTRLVGPVTEYAAELKKKRLEERRP